MKKILLSLGTIAAVAAPIISIASCSVGSVFKSKINSVEEAKEDLKIVFNELKEKGTLDDKVNKFTSTFLAKDILNFENNITTEQVIGMTYKLDNLELKQGKRAILYRDWTATHYDFYSEVPVTLSDDTSAYASIFFKYDKTNGIWARSNKSWLINGAIALGNAMTKLKHVISDITISTEHMYTEFED